jgi:hypothetical protein
MATVGVCQTQAYRAKFGGMPVNEFARYAERSRQFTDRHEWVIFGISHIQQTAPALGVPPTIAAESSAPSLQHRAEFMRRVYSIFKGSGLRRAPRGVMLLSR